jgi:hypothetical protein
MFVLQRHDVDIVSSKTWSVYCADRCHVLKIVAHAQRSSPPALNSPCSLDKTVINASTLDEAMEHISSMNQGSPFLAVWL